MKAVRITAQADGTMAIAPLPLPTMERKGDASAENYHRLARGEAPATNYLASQVSDVLRTIVLSDGTFNGLASQPGALLNFVISGDLTLNAGPSQNCKLEAGDIFLTDGKSGSKVSLDVCNIGRLVQIAVSPDWPGAEAKVYRPPGTINPHQGSTPKFKRIIKGEGDDEKAYVVDFPELFPTTRDRWSSPRPLAGFKMLCWENGWMDYHPCPIPQMGVVSSGEFEVEVRGGPLTKHVFRAGDVSLAEDRTGEGHIGRARSSVYVTNFVLKTEFAWTQE